MLDLMMRCQRGSRRPIIRLALILAGLVLFGSADSASAQMPDIIDTALENPLDAVLDGQPVRFGSPALDHAERALRDGVPRPWTLQLILPLFNAAATDWMDAQRSRDTEGFDRSRQAYRQALVDHLGTVLAASRDPRAALALGRLIEAEDAPGLKVSTLHGLYDYFVHNPRYVAPAQPQRADGSPAGGGGNFADVLRRQVPAWLRTNRAQLEAEAAAILSAERQSSEQNIAPTPEELRAILDRLIGQFEARNPRLRVVTADGREVRSVQYQLTITSMQPDKRWSRMNESVNPDNGWISIRPAGMIGETAFSVQGILRVPGYEAAEFEIADSSVRPEPVVTLVPLSSE
jgi:hypothetical protein